MSQRIHYSLLARDAEHELVPIALDQGSGILVWAPLANGLLAEGRERGRDDADVAGWGIPPVHDIERAFTILDAVRMVADGHGVSMAQVSLTWTLQRPAVCSLILGPSDEQRLSDALAAADLQLTSDDLAALDAASAVPVPYPCWHQALSTADRPNA